MANDSTPELRSRGIPGTKLQLGMAEYVLSPITVGRFRDLEADWDSLYEMNEDGTTFKLNGPKRSALMARFIFESLRRNYSKAVDDEGNLVELTEDLVVNSLVDLGNRDFAYAAVMGISGMQPTGEALAGPEAEAVASPAQPSPPSSTD